MPTDNDPTCPTGRELVARFELALEPAVASLDVIYDAVARGGCAIGHLEVYRTSEGAGCHLVVRGVVSEVLALDEHLRGLPGVRLGGRPESCQACDARTNHVTARLQATAW